MKKFLALLVVAVLALASIAVAGAPSLRTKHISDVLNKNAGENSHSTNR